MVRGLQALDRRTAAARDLVEWRSELLADLGGQGAISAQQMALVEMAVRTRLFIDHADAWLLEQGSLVNARKRSLIPLVRERQTLVDSLTRILGQLGLERRVKPAVDLQTYVATKYGKSASGAHSEASIPQGDAKETA